MELDFGNLHWPFAVKRPRRSKMLVAYTAGPAAGNLEIRATLVPPNPWRWNFVWALVEVFPNEGTEKILDGTGLNGNPGSLTLGEALESAARAYAAESIRRGG